MSPPLVDRVSGSRDGVAGAAAEGGGAASASNCFLAFSNSSAVSMPSSLPFSNATRADIEILKNDSGSLFQLEMSRNGRFRASQNKKTRLGFQKGKKTAKKTRL
jgi:hypothetical protein